ncbi:MAG: hypothetical protein AAF958_03695 [Planctomycetota bacterium]
MNHRSLKRNGSALLVVTIAAAIVAMFTLTLSRSVVVHSLEVEGAVRHAEARLTADAAQTYAVSRLKLNPAERGRFADAGLQNLNNAARYEIVDAGSGQVRIDVYLDPQAIVPFSQRVVDPLTL